MHICLLDIDGTLVLTGGAGQAAFAQTLADDFGISNLNQHVPFAGRSDRAIVADFFQHHEVPFSEHNWQRFCRGYLQRLDATLASHQGDVLPGVVTLLETLTLGGKVAIGLLTGNLREGARRKLSHYNLWHWFSFGGFGDDHVERNDIAATALAAAHAHLNGHGHATNPASAGARIGNVVVIGDTLHDIRCGQSIGARCVGVATGHTPVHELKTANPDVVVNTLAEIEPILGLLGS